MTSETAQGVETIVYGDFADLLKPESKWAIGGFPGWEFREPDAVVVVQNGRLRVAAVPLTRGNGVVQILDNAKHMYFSKETFAVPAGGSITVELDIRAQKFNGVPDDFYDGFVSLNLLDFSTGIAVDFFVSNEAYATVYARLPSRGRAWRRARGTSTSRCSRSSRCRRGRSRRTTTRSRTTRARRSCGSRLRASW